MPTRLASLLATLEGHYGRPPPPRITDPWQMILHENAAYLVDDERREEVFASLKKQIGLRPADLLKAGRRDIASAIARGGMQPERRAQKLIDAAEILTTEFDGALAPILGLAEPKARKALRLFPGVGDPFADRIFLYTGTRPTLALDSNAVRVLVRLGYGAETANYAKMYKSAQIAAAAELPEECGARTRASLLLRRHGQTLCRRSAPDCPACPLRRDCPAAAGSGGE